MKQACGIFSDLWYVKCDFINIDVHMGKGK